MCTKYKSNLGNFEFIIEEDKPDVGWYLYVYENQNCVKDYLQDDLQMAMKVAKDDFSVPTDSWVKIKNNN